MNLIIRIYQTVLINIGLWCFTRMYSHVNIYSPDKKEVKGITFTYDKDYIEYVNKYEQAD